jgi:hypothetical protein
MIDDIAAHTQHRVGPEARRDNVCVSDGQVVAFREQVQVFVNRFLDRLRNAHLLWQRGLCTTGDRREQKTQTEQNP